MARGGKKGRPRLNHQTTKGSDRCVGPGANCQDINLARGSNQDKIRKNSNETVVSIETTEQEQQMGTEL